MQQIQGPHHPVLHNNTVSLSVGKYISYFFFIYDETQPEAEKNNKQAHGKLAISLCYVDLCVICNIYTQAGVESSQ